jgi:hypothetical protein
MKEDSIKTKLHLELIAYNNTIHSSTKRTPFEIINLDRTEILDIKLESQLVNNYIQTHRNKIKLLHELVNKDLNDYKLKTITRLNKNREDIPTIPETVFIKSNFCSKTRNKYKKDKIDRNTQRKTVQPEIDKNKTGRKFTKLHMDNIKRPTRADTSLLQDACPALDNMANKNRQGHNK